MALTATQVIVPFKQIKSSRHSSIEFNNFKYTHKRKNWFY